ncbi:hypothetical protein, partial [Plasmodium yoelii yoelii]
MTIHICLITRQSLNMQPKKG